jgi:Domain of unknown function (DUF4331)
MKQAKRSDRRSRSLVALSAVGVTLAASGLSGLSGGVANASSHREAPLTAADPQHDNTDTYAFVSPDRSGTVTLIANWIPNEEPNGGPNFYPWAAGSHYDINIDSNGDGKADITYRWIFKNVDKRGTTDHGDTAKGTFLYNDGVVNNLTDKTLLFKQTYDLLEIKGGTSKTLVNDAVAAPSDVGRASMPNYANLRDQAIVDVEGGGKTVATQAADPFFLDLRVFDLLYGANLKESGQNTLAGYNVNSVALQLPKSALALKGNPTRNPVIGVWSTTEKQGATLSPGKATPTGGFVQVSRLGNPLVNELVIPAQLKDAFNGLTPNQDATVTEAVQKVTDPELPRLIEKIYGLKAPAAPRNDLKEIFLTGICKACGPIKADLNSQMLNKDGLQGADFVPAEELRLNMSVPVTSNPNRLGVLAMDLQGYPNGRRLTDDAVDISILAVEGTAMSGKIPPALAGGDGVNAPANRIGSSFPYLALPNSASVNEASSKGTANAMPSGGVATGNGGTAVLSGSAGLPAGPVTAALVGLVLAGAGVTALGRGRRRQSPAPALS